MDALQVCYGSLFDPDEQIAAQLTFLPSRSYAPGAAPIEDPTP
jgi:hypothetical protein